jgi:DNA-binding PadR family transcriptional regulator
MNGSQLSREEKRLAQPPTERQRRRVPRLRKRRFLPTYPRLLELVYRWQYVDRDILMALEPALWASLRTLQDQLQGLESLGYIKASERSSFSEANLYSITPSGVHQLSELTGEDDLAITSDSAIKSLFVDHARAVSWFQTHVELVARGREDLKIVDYERRYHHPARRLGGGAWVPDLGFVVARRLPRGQVNVALYLVEIDRGTMRPAAIFDKLEQSNHWYYTVGRDYLRELYRRHGAGEPKATYHRLIVTQHRRGTSDFDRLVTLYTQGLRFADGQRRNMYFATAADIVANRGYDRPVWYPINTFSYAWRNPIEAELAARPESAYPYVANRLRHLDRIAMFPPPIVNN